MTPFLVDEPFTSHSGLRLRFKIDADALTDEDLATVAHEISTRRAFNAVHFIPRGGYRFAVALFRYVNPTSAITLIVDDVWTTGASMEKMRATIMRAHPNANVHGIVLFARGQCSSWVEPFFILNESWR